MIQKEWNYYECGSCGMFHPWYFTGDCRDDKNRLSFDDIPEDADIYTLELQKYHIDTLGDDFLD